MWVNMPYMDAMGQGLGWGRCLFFVFVRSFNKKNLPLTPTACLPSKDWAVAVRQGDNSVDISWSLISISKAWTFQMYTVIVSTSD